MELQASLERVDDDRSRLHIVIPANDTNTLIDQFLIALAYQNNITPDEGQELEDAAIARLGREAVYENLNASITQYAFPFAAEGQGIVYIGKPQFEINATAKRDAPFTFDAICVLKPSFTLSSYDPVEITVPPLAVTEADVDNYLAQLAQSHAFLEKDSSHSDIRIGDQVELEIETFRDGVRCDQLCSEGRSYTTGADMMPEEFDQAILSMHVGETKEVKYSTPGFTLDENDQPEMDHYVSTVTVKNLQKTIIPTIDDEWIAENMQGEASTVAELREKIHAMISDRKTIEYRHFKNLQSAKALAERFEGEISDAIYDAVTADVLVAFEDQLAEQNMSKEDFLRSQGATEQQLKRHLNGQVHEQLVRQFALDAVAEHFNLELTDDDLNEYFRAAATPGLEAMIRLDFERNGKMPEARLSAMRLKANDYVTEHATIHIEG